MHKRRCSGGRRYNRPAARIESAPRRTLIFETLCALSPRRGGAETLQGLTGERASASHVNSGTTAPHRARTPHSAEPLRGAAAPHRRTPPQSGTAPHRRLAYEKIGTADFNLKSSEPGASTARRRVLRGLTGITVATRRFRSLRGLSVREMFRQQFRVSDEQASNQNRGWTVLSTLVMWG